MRLFHSPASPFVRKVMVTLIETGMAGRVTLINTATTPMAPDAGLIGSNPLGKIPALELDSGEVIVDSRVICRWIDAQTNDGAGAGLYGPAGQEWPLLTLEAMADGVLDAAVLMVYEWRMRPEERRHAPWVEGQWSKIARALDAIDSRWMHHLEAPLNIGQIAMGAVLGYLDFRHPDRQWRAAHPHLAAWEADFSTRPSMQQTAPVVV
ncbi:MAG: glutathione S-transferase [Gemmobacter sp.]|uniref:glutathione S-transferase n=1 Tax=Gemmobacter sp. TaxID=1898957 RepID=UPI001A56CEC7|nr:glutathione S-transferase [Gemmobacter sp.]MBL8561007.1 glutathione S-transferase [Gemmobacter sp.]